MAGTEGTQLCTFCACLFLHFFIQMMEHFYGQMLCLRFLQMNALISITHIISIRYIFFLKILAI